MDHLCNRLSAGASFTTRPNAIGAQELKTPLLDGRLQFLTARSGKILQYSPTELAKS